MKIMTLEYTFLRLAAQEHIFGASHGVIRASPHLQKVYDLTVYVETVVRSFSRYHKYTLGTELRNLSREVLRLIRAAINISLLAELCAAYC